MLASGVPEPGVTWLTGDATGDAQALAAASSGRSGRRVAREGDDARRQREGAPGVKWRGTPAVAIT